MSGVSAVSPTPEEAAAERLSIALTWVPVPYKRETQAALDVLVAALRDARRDAELAGEAMHAQADLRSRAERERDQARDALARAQAEATRDIRRESVGLAESGYVAREQGEQLANIAAICRAALGGAAEDGAA